MAEDHPSITCPVCGMTSYHPEDIRHGYCGKCHDYTAEPRGCVRAYLVHVRGDDNPDPARIFEFVERWSRDRGAGEPVIDWLRRQHGQ